MQIKRNTVFGNENRVPFYNEFIGTGQCALFGRGRRVRLSRAWPLPLRVVPGIALFCLL